MVQGSKKEDVFVLILAGTFQMGCDIRDNKAKEGDNYPVYDVSWFDALVYCNKRSIAERTYTMLLNRRFN